MSHLKPNVLAKNWQLVLSEFVKESELEVHSVVRKRKLDAESIFQILVLGCLETPQATLTDFAQTARALGIDVSGSSIDSRINAKTHALLKRVFELILQRLTTIPSHVRGLLDAFSQVMILDSTQIALPSHMQTDFAGNGDNAELKLQVVLNYLTGQISHMAFQHGRTPDQISSLGQDTLSAGELLLFDLGYFKQERLQEIDQKEAFFVTRCHSQVGLYTIDTQKPVVLVDMLAHHSCTQFEWHGRLGTRSRLDVRVVARRVPQQRAEARKRRAQAKAKRQGYSCSERHLKWLEWDVLVTNLDSNWDAECLFILYGIRWQVELVFKVWKSRFAVATYGKWRKQRVMCQLYARLIGAWLCHMTVGNVDKHPLRRMSLAKSVVIIRHNVATLCSIICHHWRAIGKWATRLELALVQFALQDKHKKTPTLAQKLMGRGLS